jgi:hypothetical protein
MAQMKKAAAKPTPKGGSGINAIAKRFGITAREARDIATAVTTLGKAVVTPASTFGGSPKKPAAIVRAVGNVAKQAGETYTAATKGKSGTSSGKLKTMIRGSSGLPADVQYYGGTKRKQGNKK